jgi:single-strand DNA-binding protein
MGNFTRDVEIRYLQSGTAVADIGLAVNDRRKSAQGEWIEETTFVDVTLWGRTAEVAGEFLSKGSSVLIEGRLKLDTWETDGQKRSKLKVVCERMQMLGSRSSSGGGGGSPPQRSDADEAHSEYHDEEHAMSTPSGTPKDDIPF